MSLYLYIRWFIINGVATFEREFFMLLELVWKLKFPPQFPGTEGKIKLFFHNPHESRNEF
jgi:hypothetical protein